MVSNKICKIQFVIAKHCTLYCMLSGLIAYKANNDDHQYDFGNQEVKSPKMMTLVCKC